MNKQPAEKNPSPAKKKGLLTLISESVRARMICSLLGALTVWTYVTMFVQPNTTQKITGVPVDFSYGSLTYTQQGLSIVNDPEYYVTVIAYGDGFVIGSLSKEDFTVYPDYSSVKSAGESSLRLNVKCNANVSGGSVQVELENKSTRVDVVFDTVTELTLPISTQMVDVAVEEGYIINKSVVLPAEVTLTGPAGELSNVAKAVAQVTATEPLKETVSVQAPLCFLDEEGRALSFTYVTSEIETAEVDITVYKLAEIPISLSFINKPIGFDSSVLRYSLSQRSLNVAGPASLIERMSEVNIGAIDLSTFALDRVYEMPITLPDGVVSQDNVQQVTVSFNSSALGTKVLNLPAECVEVVNLPEGYQMEVVSDRIMNVTLCGPKDVLNGLTAQSVVARIDAQDMPIVTGQQNIAVSLYVPSAPQVFAIGGYTVQCRIASE